MRVLPFVEHYFKHKQRRDHACLLLCLCFVFGCMNCDAMETASEKKPNIIFILADDLGYGDVGCYGAQDLKTPHIDSLARDGMKFTSFYVHQRCSPTRLAFMTGSYAHRAGTTKVIYPRDLMGINPDEITTPELLKKGGYTCGLAGKWHLGDWELFHPLHHGFDYYIGAWHVMSEQAEVKDKKIEGGEQGEEGGAFVENRTIIAANYKKTGETEHKEVDGALRFIENNKDKPFMLYYASRITHSKWLPSPAFEGTSTRANKYGDVVQELDFQVGRILKKVDDLGLTNNTLIIFASDNGAPLNKEGPSNAPLRDGKWTDFEGGIRVPCIMRWPGRIVAGSQTDNISFIADLLPTFCAIADVQPPHDRVIDGINILPIMFGSTNVPQRREHMIMNKSVIRSGDWKLFLKYEKPGGHSKGSDDRKPAPEGALFNVKTDPGEKNNVADEHPDIVKKLRALAAEFDKELTTHSRPIGRVQ